MIKTTTKIVALTAVTLILAATPLFAQGMRWNGRGNTAAPQATRHGAGCQCQACLGTNQNGNTQGREAMRHSHMGFGMGRGSTDSEMVMGTVKSVDEGKGTITVTNADGKQVSVHVNPMTLIVKMPARTAPASGNTAAPTAPQAPATLSLSDIPAGTWVSIRKYNTDTSTIEAACIMLVE